MTSEVGDLAAGPRRIGAGTILLIAATVLVTLLGLAFCAGQYLIRRQVQAELARIRAAGEPVTAADLEAFYALPADTRDATALWMAAIRTVSQPRFQMDAQNISMLGDKETNSLPEPGDAWPEQDEVERFLGNYAELMATLHEAAAIGGAARYPTRFSDGAAMTFEPRPKLRLLVRLLALEAEVHARRGDSHAAARSIHAMFALTRSLEYEPLLVSQLLRLVQDGAAVHYFERLLMAADLAEEDLVMIDSDLDSIDCCEAFRRSMFGHRVLGMQAFAHPKEELGPEAPSAVAWAIFGQGDLALYLQVMRDLVLASEAGDPAALADTAARDDLGIIQAPANWRYQVTKTFFLTLQAFCDSVRLGTARRDTARLAIAMERYRHRNDHWPESLDDLVPEFAERVPTDPFSTAPMKLRMDETGCRIYSVGQDGIDQRGSDETGPVGDIVFRMVNRKEAASPKD